jgi:hypothetical protein
LVVGVHDALHQVLVRGKGAGLTQQFIDQRGLAMVNVRDNRDVAKQIAQVDDPSSSAISPSSSNTTP